MNTLFEQEEKKDAKGYGDNIGGNVDWASGEESEDEELGDLPPDIATQIGQHFDSEQALEATLIKAGVGRCWRSSCGFDRRGETATNHAVGATQRVHK